MVVRFAELEIDLQWKWLFRPRQRDGMTLDDYYVQFCSWKEEMISVSFPAKKEDYVEGFVKNLKWDIRWRSSKYESSRIGLKIAYHNAKFEEYMMQLEVYSHTPVLVNQTAESDPPVVEEISDDKAASVAHEMGSELASCNHSDLDFNGIQGNDSTNSEVVPDLEEYKVSESALNSHSSVDSSHQKQLMPMDSGFKVLSIYCAHMAPKWNNILEMRPKQSNDMSVEVYYDQFFNWKRKLEEVNDIGGEESYIDDFIYGLELKLGMRVCGYKWKPHTLYGAFRRAVIEETLMKNDADKVLDDMPQLKSSDIQGAENVSDEYGKVVLDASVGSQFTIKGTLIEENNEPSQLLLKTSTGVNEVNVVNGGVAFPITDLQAALGSLGDTTMNGTCNGSAKTWLEGAESIFEVVLGQNARKKYAAMEMMFGGKMIRWKDASIMIDEMPPTFRTSSLNEQLTAPYIRGINSNQLTLFDPGGGKNFVVSVSRGTIFPLITEAPEILVDSLKGIDGLIMFIYDPGGCCLFYNGCVYSEFNVYQGDCCLDTIMVVLRLKSNPQTLDPRTNANKDQLNKNRDQRNVYGSLLFLSATFAITLSLSWYKESIIVRHIIFIERKCGLYALDGRMQACATEFGLCAIWIHIFEDKDGFEGDELSAKLIMFNDVGKTHQTSGVPFLFSMIMDIYIIKLLVSLLIKLWQVSIFELHRHVDEAGCGHVALVFLSPSRKSEMCLVLGLPNLLHRENITHSMAYFEAESYNTLRQITPKEGTSINRYSNFCILADVFEWSNPWLCQDPDPYIWILMVSVMENKMKLFLTKFKGCREAIKRDHVWDQGQNVLLYILGHKVVFCWDMTEDFGLSIVHVGLYTSRLGKIELGLTASDLKHFKQSSDSHGYDYVFIATLQNLVWDPGQNFISFYILEGKDVFEWMGKWIIRKDHITELILIMPMFVSPREDHLGVSISQSAGNVSFLISLSSQRGISTKDSETIKEKGVLPSTSLQTLSRREFLIFFENVIMSIINYSVSLHYLLSVSATTALIFMRRDLEPCEWMQYQNQVIDALKIRSINNVREMKGRMLYDMRVFSESQPLPFCCHLVSFLNPGCVFCSVSLMLWLVGDLACYLIPAFVFRPP